jgi:superoxide dismutase, Fe-Mn family
MYCAYIFGNVIEREKDMKFELPPLPYPKNALEPHMSRETVEYHYEKHHRGYLTKLQAAIEGTPEAERGLGEIVLSSKGSVFNNAAQVWNHTFFWNCMEPKGGGDPGGEIGHRLRDGFGSFDKFRLEFIEAGASRFGSGYVWLVGDRDGALRVTSTANADNPLTKHQVPLLTCDVWEHAYYLDYRGGRADYLKAFLGQLVNWERVADSLERLAQTLAAVEQPPRHLRGVHAGRS